MDGDGDDRERSHGRAVCAVGLVGLLDAVPPPGDYVVEIHGTRRRQAKPGPISLQLPAAPPGRKLLRIRGPSTPMPPPRRPEVTVEFKQDEEIFENRVDAGRTDGSLGRDH